MHKTPGVASKVWAAAAAGAILAGAAWLAAPGPTALAVCAIATGVAVLMAVSLRRSWVRVTTVVLVGFCAAAASQLLVLERLTHRWPQAAAELNAASAAAMQRALETTAASLDRVAQSALAVPPGDAPHAFAALASLLPRSSDWSVELARDGQRVAWAGIARARPVGGAARLAPQYAIVQTPFYIVLQVVAARGPDRATAAAVLHAEPPADHLAAALDRDVARRTGVDGFLFSALVGGLAPGSSVYAQFAPEPGGPVLLTATPLPPRQAGAILRATDRARRHSGMILALALLLFMAAQWQPPAQRTVLASRLAALGVALATLALVPFSAFSNTTQLFDPTYYFSAVGGPFTGSVGVLGLAGGVLLLAALAMGRARPRLWHPWLAAVVAAAVALGTPIVALRLATGITPPGAGVPLSIWLAWHTSLALVVTALLFAAASMARGVVDRRAGLRLRIPPQVAIGIAVIAAVIGPIIWDLPGQWPEWYLALWVAAAVAVVFARPTKWGVFPAVAVAGLGASLLVWGTAAEKRLVLAERDVEGLSRPEADVVELLDRFGAEVAGAPAPRNRADLLKLYARSVLADADYPVALGLWFGDGRPPERLAVSTFASDSATIVSTVAAASNLQSGVIGEGVGSPGVQLVLAVPTTSHTGDVLSAVVAPQTRLIRDSPIGPFLGLPIDTAVAPLYTISLLDAPYGSPAIGDSAQQLMPWRRRGSVLHADWLVRGAQGPARAHVEVQLLPLGALIQRGVLLLVLEFLVVGPLWVLSAIGDGALRRWLRARMRRWRRSYRTRLTLVLFAFFVAPAVVFAIWAERRLRADDITARALRVSETLRSVIAEGDLARLPVAGERLETPLLLYNDGELAATSDTLYADLASLGRLLRPDIQIGLGLGEEVEASRTAVLAGVRTLVGYRVAQAAGRGGNGGHAILAAPARVDAAELERPNADLRILVLFTTVFGAGAALWLSGLAARQLARPIEQLRRAALAVARGDREPALSGSPPVEFSPVFSAFRRMAADFGESQRVLAWGEMARQVAHEIKNPLTPIRLGVQHLLRAHSDPRVDFERVLEQNAGRILSEIDRLDEIARAFSRYGTAPAERAPAEPTDVAAVAQDVLELERLGAPGGGGIQWELDGPVPDRAGGNGTGVWARARAEELREVLLNLLENARSAKARRVRIRCTTDTGGGRVTITVDDNGEGIAAEILPRIFEPHFSTRTSGSGLGLAVSRRVIDGWGGSIAVTSERGRGTRVTITLLAP